MRLSCCDTVFLLDYPPDVCLEGAKARIGRQREELPWLEEELDEGLRQSILDFPDTKLPQIYQLLERYSGEKEIHIFRSREDAEDYLDIVASNELS
jgi:hypothetical protein